MTPRHAGTLSRWNEERGFGFIAPQSGGEDVFVHVTAFPRGQKPTLGEYVTFEIDTAPDGRKRATRVILPNNLQLTPVAKHRAAPARHRVEPERATPPSRRATRPHRQQQSFPFGNVLVLACVIAAGAIGYKQYQKRATQAPAFLETPTAAYPTAHPIIQEQPRFQCDGRQHCSQMRSCAEATFFLKNCPGTQMDGDHDGIPCESQWCG